VAIRAREILVEPQRYAVPHHDERRHPVAGGERRFDGIGETFIPLIIPEDQAVHQDLDAPWRHLSRPLGFVQIDDLLSDDHPEESLFPDVFERLRDPFRADASEEGT